MRALAAVLAVAAALALAGCSSQPNSPVDPETTDSDDYEVPLLILSIAVIVGVVLLAINLSSQWGSPPPPPPAGPSTPPQPPPGWQAIDEPAASPVPTKASKPAPKARRRAP
jgi:hypothetical protein